MAVVRNAFLGKLFDVAQADALMVLATETVIDVHPEHDS